MKTHLPSIPLLTLVPTLFLLLRGCQIPGSSVDLNRQTKVIEMTKGPCYGSCPVYTLSIYENGVATYKGERNTDRIGLYVKNLDRNRFQELLSAFSQANLWQYQNVYRGMYPDRQTVTITYYEEGDFKTITGKDGRPEAVVRLEEKLDDIANSTGWELKEKNNYGLPDNVIANELIVQLRDGVEVQSWVRKYQSQEMKTLKEITPNRNYWLVSYNEDLLEPPRMLSKVRGDFDVIGAEYNKKGGGRH